MRGGGLATGSGDNKTRIYLLGRNAKPELKYTLLDAGNWMTFVAFSSNGAWLATGSVDRKTRIYALTQNAEPELKYTLKHTLRRQVSEHMANRTQGHSALT